MVGFEIIFTNISLTISQHMHFITPTFRASHMRHSPTSPYYVFIILVFDCTLLVSKYSTIFLTNNF